MGVRLASRSSNTPSSPRAANSGSALMSHSAVRRSKPTERNIGIGEMFQRGRAQTGRAPELANVGIAISARRDQLVGVGGVQP